MKLFSFMIGTMLSLSLLAQAPTSASGTLRVGIQHDINATNPHQSLDTITSTVLGNVFDTLVRYADETFDIIPGLALSWTSSEDFTKWTYTLRPGVTFHDGTPLTADIVVKSFMDVPNFPIEVSRDGEMNVVFSLKEGNAKFNDILAHPSKSVIHPSMIGNGSKAIGTGPFKFGTWQSGKSISLTPNPSWWGGKVKAPEVMFIVYPNENALVNDMIAGKIDLAEWLSGDSIPALRKADNVTVKSSLGNNVGFLAMNTSHSPFERKEVREAVAHSINVVELTRTFFPGGTGAPATTFLPPPIFKTQGHPKSYNPTQAKDLLTKSGASLSKPMVLLQTWAPRPYMPDPAGIAKAVKESLENIGFTIRIVNDPDNFFTRLRAGDFDLCLSGWIGDSSDPVEFLAANFHSNYIGLQNLPRWSDPQFDRLIQTARVSKGFPFKKAMDDALGRMGNGVPLVPLFWGAQSAAWSKSVQGYHVHPSNHMILWNVSKNGS
ncbi:MAG TPA: ABC transporter substrate-binding protein [Thermoanaerobaculia bacterium]|nr:ABC transporter substrate-binding protein [Thermoanaerobaculia bacterium]HUM30703.1 ABC transporter substrate-binding protein [Thermoanaerobaculia bacterium]HXK68889.1 ABC transporter substrate-binding protein [Thermoanaerobaculia bacterium]